MENNKLTYISLFSCGGVGCYAFKQAGFECIATNEINEKRLQIQKYNKKCFREEGYVEGDICLQTTKDRIFSELSWWKKHEHIKDVDVIIATPPCQGMSVANHKKKNETARNSLVLESIDLILGIMPKFFIFENVPAFLKTICDTASKKTIEQAIEDALGKLYSVKSEIINFKNYGANSSRCRTLLIGVRKDYSKYISPIELFPFKTEERTLQQVIGSLKPLTAMAEIDPDDIYHAFRPYPDYMRRWIHDLKEGHSAFENEDELSRPYKIENGCVIPNQNKNGDKYTRLSWNKVSPGIHTRNDQLASQSTIHPRDDRVLSIRELMKVMSIPDSFMWSDMDVKTLNALPESSKLAYLKKNGMLIRQCIGEAVPTGVFARIAKKMKEFLLLPPKTDKELGKLIENNNLENFDILADFIDKNEMGEVVTSRLIELANNKREENAAYYTGKNLLDSVFEIMPTISKDEIRVLEPSVGAGNFLPFIISKYSEAKKLIIDAMDIDEKVLAIIEKKYAKASLPDNVELNFICGDFLKYNSNMKYDIIIGNPPFKKLGQSQQLTDYRQNSVLKNSHNLVSFFIEKALNIGEAVLFILPKSLINLSEYRDIRNYISNRSITTIIDFGEKAFVGVNIETICISICANKKPNNTKIISKPRELSLTQKQKYIMQIDLPNWVIYRDSFFDMILSSKQFGVFNIYRDRQLSKKNTYDEGDIWVIQARNLLIGESKLEHVNGYDKYAKASDEEKLSSRKYLNSDNSYLVPNMTYYPRIIKKPIGTLFNGSVVLLTPKNNIFVSAEDIAYICSKEYEKFYRIAINHATRTINVDDGIGYYYCINRTTNRE